jgi:hypothetical protein
MWPGDDRRVLGLASALAEGFGDRPVLALGFVLELVLGFVLGFVLGRTLAVPV